MRLVVNMLGFALQSFIKLARYEEGHVQMKLGRKATPYLMFEAKRTENARLIVQEVPVSKVWPNL